MLFSIIAGQAKADIVPEQVEAPSKQIPDAIQLANEYLAALTARDYGKLSRFYSRETKFVDRTAKKTLTGGSDILTFLRRIHVYTLDYSFEVDHAFHSGSLVVYIGTYKYKSRGDLFGKPGQNIELQIPGVTTIEVDLNDREIKTHTDLLDYDTMRDQLAAQ
ncbi:nuclear transport factor 2 family protein [Ferrimonas aestuarii]|uniref:Nuclear transport factor 2 family protein n=1 Tax=Ferrimonas aestuarii TaxID=2569539 RepID=A0A4U1BS83_9GAMM|nr:nuclear transport factor 2 family protein [Ferrimonas aestuarii]TKB54766.1 nuclear transport factor 2 family protein [Ferrimonas aestuarii]